MDGQGQVCGALPWGLFSNPLLSRVDPAMSLRLPPPQDHQPELALAPPSTARPGRRQRGGSHTCASRPVSSMSSVSSQAHSGSVVRNADGSDAIWSSRIHRIHTLVNGGQKHEVAMGGLFAL